ncbi:hypothetical protein QR680_005603 [Steinernema hermaphroditum]|uniref:Protein sleepless n=1 Tax=Steinernema hermaphroditum TaxID=289476 RepID=A0AA39HTY4_9BILA|nr:hypothetical protein QR680_005603 [Steinernema hermaphroditum]
MPRAVLLFCLLLTIYVDPAKTLLCMDGIDCDYGCAECEGVACLKIIRPAIPSGIAGHLDQHESIARTCLPYDTRDLDLEPAGCRTNLVNGQKICICYSGDYCNAGPPLSPPLVLVGLLATLIIV